MHLLINWMLSALALWLLPRIIAGIEVRNYGTALIATVVIAIVNTLVGWPLKLLTLPLTHAHPGPVLAGPERLPAEAGIRSSCLDSR